MKRCKFCGERNKIRHAEITYLPDIYYIPLFGGSDETDKSIKVKLGGGDYIAIVCDNCKAIGPVAKSKAWATRRWNGGKNEML